MKLSSCTLVLATLCTLSHGTFVLLQEDLKEEVRFPGANISIEHFIDPESYLV